jgi:hypothetical protein
MQAKRDPGLDGFHERAGGRVAPMRCAGRAGAVTPDRAAFAAVIEQLAEHGGNAEVVADLPENRMNLFCDAEVAQAADRGPARSRLEA